MSSESTDEFWLKKSIKLCSELKLCASIYMPGYNIPSPTDLRMLWQTKSLHDGAELAERLHRLDQVTNDAMDHGGGVGRSSYTKGKARNTAENSKKLTQAFFGDELVSFPEYTEEELLANIDVMKARWASAQVRGLCDGARRLPTAAQCD